MFERKKTEIEYMLNSLCFRPVICSGYTLSQKKGLGKLVTPSTTIQKNSICQHVHPVRRFDLCCVCRPAWPCHLAQLSVSSGDHVLSM